MLRAHASYFEIMSECSPINTPIYILFFFHSFLQQIRAYVSMAAIIGIAFLKPTRAILYHHGLVPVPAYNPSPALSFPLLAFNQHNQQQQQQHLIQANVLGDLHSVKNTNTLVTSPLSDSFFYSNIGSVNVKPTNDFFGNELETYFHNGRYLKQYLVMEENLDDTNELDAFLSRFVPYVPSNYNIQAAVRRPAVGFAPAPGNGFFSVPRNPATPIQLGSGSLGYLRLPNGAIYLGSGSLGYTNDQQKAIELANVRNRQSPGASPLTFGETPR